MTISQAEHKSKAPLVWMHKVTPLFGGANAQGIVDEAYSPDYWFCASKDGNRESHYRGRELRALFALRVLDALQMH